MRRNEGENSSAHGVGSEEGRESGTKKCKGDEKCGKGERRQRTRTKRIVSWRAPNRGQK
jgi:hypothetical protein